MLRFNRKRPRDSNGDDRLFAPKISKKSRTNDILKRELIPTRSPPSTPVTNQPVIALTPKSTFSSPEWYTDVQNRTRFKRKDVIAITDLRRFHELAKKAVANKQDPEAEIKLVRKTLNQLSCAYFVTKANLKNSNILTDGTFHEIFDPVTYSSKSSSVIYSAAVRSDAQALYDKWFNGDLDGHILRGIRPHIGKTRNFVKNITSNYRTYDPEKDYPQTSSVFFGAGHLKNGDWWPLQFAAVRDGAHGDKRAGISGIQGQGAYSIVMNMGSEKDFVEPTEIDDVYNKYPNFDLPSRDQIWYCGTQGKANKSEKKGTPSAGTQLLQLSFAKNKPIRVIRGSKVNSKLRPKKGLRYDGLYRIIRSVCICEEFATRMFLLERLPHQDPIRYEGDDQRPHEAEFNEWCRWEAKASAHKLL